MVHELPVCPLTSVGTGIDMACSLNKCAWYIPSVKKCAVYLMGYNAILDANEKQKAKQPQK